MFPPKMALPSKQLNLTRKELKESQIDHINNNRLAFSQSKIFACIIFF